MKDVHMRVWPSALYDLGQKFIHGQPHTLWYHDEEIEFHVVKMQSRGNGRQIELSGVTQTGKTVIVVVYTGSETDIVELNFYSTG